MSFQLPPSATLFERVTDELARSTRPAFLKAFSEQIGGQCDPELDTLSFECDPITGPRHSLVLPDFGCDAFAVERVLMAVSSTGVSTTEMPPGLRVVINGFAFAGKSPYVREKDDLTHNIPHEYGIVIPAHPEAPPTVVQAFMDFGLQAATPEAWGALPKHALSDEECRRIVPLLAELSVKPICCKADYDYDSERGVWDLGLYPS